MAAGDMGMEAAVAAGEGVSRWTQKGNPKVNI
jgi:hypothetical protein